MPDSQDLSLFRSVTVPDSVPASLPDSQRDLEAGLGRAHQSLFQLMPPPNLNLTPEERLAAERQRLTSIVMDAAGKGPMRCDALCPFRTECSLFAVRKHPLGQLCPFETDYLRERFLGWLREFGKTLDNLLESERLAISELCCYQLELQHVRFVLARPQNVEMNQVSVRDVNAETGEPICWENVIHTAAEREDQIVTAMRMILKDFELTRESQTKKAKALGLRPGNDLASRQSVLYDKIRSRLSPVVVDAESIPIS